MGNRIHTFSRDDRVSSVREIVSFEGVPMPRSHALILDSAQRAGHPVSIYSCIRTDSIIEEHNRRFGTDLHGQQWLVDAHKRDPLHFAAANSPQTTSHCWFSDGNGVYIYKGNHIPATGKLPWFMVGLDVDDTGSIEDNHRLLSFCAKHGYHFVAPYRVGSERHHLVLVTNPLAALVLNGLHVRTLRPGMSGNDVKRAQMLLRGVGEFNEDHKIGTKYGTNMKAKVRHFKRRHKLTADYILGAAAWRALEREYDQKR